MILRHRDLELLRFEWVEPQGVRIVSVNEAALRFMPLEFKGVVSDETLWRWMVRRIVPRNRRNIQDLLARMGLDSHNVRGIVEICLGLSLNDVHWIVPDDSSSRWKDCNLYDNPFSSVVAQIAFTGMGSPVRDEWTSSPELTTNGMLAKCWRRVDGDVVLYKSGTEGASNAGFEPYSEYYAAQIAEALGLPHVRYGLSKFKKRLCSTCPLFTSDKFGFIPAGRLVSLEEALNDARLADVFFFDALIFNTDRHMGNFGYLVDNDTNEIVGAAPIFDNGYGLFSLAVYRPGSKFNEFDDLRKFTTRVRPALYSKWLGFPTGLTPSMKERLKALHGFRFSNDNHLRLPVERLRIIEDFLQKRISQIEQYGERADELLLLSDDSCTVKSEIENSSCTVKPDIDMAICDNLRADPFITRNELSEILSVPLRTIAAHLSKLKAAGKVRRVGADKNGSWEVLDAYETEI